MTEQTVIKTYFDANGAPAARIVAKQNIYGTSERAGTYCHTTAHTVITRAGYRVNEDYYTDTQTPLQDGPIMAAWNRYSGDGYGSALNRAEASELTQRYARAYWPMVPIIERELQTGYSQGDEVTVLSWIEPANNDKTNEPAYVIANRGHEHIKSHHDIMEAVARGQFWLVELQTPSFTWETTTDPDDGDHDGNEYTVTVDWTTDDDGPYMTLCMEEFDPWAELIEYAEESFDVPTHRTSNTDTYEL